MVVCSLCESGKWFFDGEDITWFSLKLSNQEGELRDYFVCDRCKDLILGVVNNDRSKETAKTKTTK